MVILNRSYVTIVINKEKGYLYQKWRGFTPRSDFRWAVDFCMETLEACGFYKIISDVTEQSVVAPEEQKYVKEEVLRFIEKNDRFKMAFVTREKSITDACARRYDRMVKKIKNEELHEFFSSPTHAEEWILSQ